jgi:hypothetical protein
MPDSIYLTVFSDKSYTNKMPETNVKASFSVNGVLNSSSTELFDTKNSDHSQIIDNILSAQNKKVTGILPPGVVAIDDCVVIFEAPPRMVNIQHYEVARDYISDKSQLKSSYIPIPWQTYVLIHDKNYNLIDTYMYYNKKPISQNGFEEPVFLPVLPNFYSNGLLCRPFYASADDVNMYSKDVSGVIAAAYDSVWNSGWNTDLVDTIIDFNQDIKQKYTYGHNEMMSYFAKHNSNFTESLLNYNTISQITSRDLMFSRYVKLIENLDVVDSLNLLYPMVSKSHIRAQYLENLREEAREDFECNSDDEEEVDYDDLDCHIENRLIEYFAKPSSFDDVLRYILYYRSVDLNVIDPVNNNYFNYIYSKIVNSHPVQLTYSVDSEEPF